MTNMYFTFNVSPFYYFTDSGCCYRTNDILQLELKRDDVYDLLDIIECLIQIYDVSNYESWTVSNLENLLDQKLSIFWNKFIKPVMENKEITDNSSLQAFVNMVAGNYSALKKTLNSIFICMTLLKKFGCSYNTPDCDKNQRNDENGLRVIMESYWNILDDILFFRPMFSIDQNLIILLIQIFILNNAKCFINQSNNSNIQPRDAAFNRLGCFIQHWLLQGKDRNVSNIYNDILNEDLFSQIAIKLRKHIITNKKMYHIQIKSPSLKISDDQFHATILNEKKGFMKFSEDFITFADDSIKKSLVEKFKINSTVFNDLNFGIIAIFLLYKGFCIDVCLHKRHINTLKTQCMMQLNGLITNESVINNCITLILSENFVTESTIKKWATNKFIILLKEAYHKKQKFEEKFVPGKAIVMKHK